MCIRDSFRAAIEEGVAAIMSSHALYPALDPEHPATLSRAVLTGLLRKKMGHRGMIITDDLEMGAIAEGWGVAEGALAALEAGADILLICKDQDKVLESLDLIRGSVLRGEIPFQQVRTSNQRIIQAKKDFLLGRRRISLGRVREYFGNVGR